MADDGPEPVWTALPMAELKLHAGLPLQVRRLAAGAPACEAQFLGAIDEKCLFVVPVGMHGIKYGMKAGETWLVGGFTGVHDFRFEAKVMQAFDFTFRQPAYAYAVLEYPAAVQARKVRNSVRIRSSIPATASPRNGVDPAEVSIVDLNADGALLRSPVDLGETGELLSLAFSMGPYEDLAYIDALARVCHRREQDGELLVGILFEVLSERDRLTLREFAVAARE